MRRLILAMITGAAFSSIAISGIARADQPVVILQGDADNQRRAKITWNEGVELMNLVDDPSAPELDQAITKFKEAYKKYPYPGLLQALAQAYRMKNDNRRAITYFKRYLNEHRRVHKREAEDREGVLALIAELEQVATQQEASAKTPPTEAKGPAAEPDLSASTRAPGPAPVSVPSLTRSPRVAAEPWYRDTWGLTATAVAVVALAVGAGYVISAEEKRDAVPTADELQRVELRREAGQHERIGLVTLAGGGVVGVLGLAMLIYNPDPDAPRLEVTGDVSSVSVGFRVAF